MSTPTAAQWLEACNKLAAAARRPDESFEQSFARVVKAGAGRAFLEMHRHPQGRLPARVTVVYKGQQAESAETQLHRLAVGSAHATGQSYEICMAELLATPQGLELWQKARAEGPSVACPE